MSLRSSRIRENSDFQPVLLSHLLRLEMGEGEGCGSEPDGVELNTPGRV